MPPPVHPSCIGTGACGSANYWYRQFRQYGHNIKQISTQYVKPFRMGSKHDKNGAVAIVEAGSRPSMCYVLEKYIEQSEDGEDR